MTTLSLAAGTWGYTLEDFTAAHALQELSVEAAPLREVEDE